MAETLQQQQHPSLKSFGLSPVCICPCEGLCTQYYLHFCLCDSRRFLSCFLFHRAESLFMSVAPYHWIIYRDVELEKDLTLPGQGVEQKEPGIWWSESFKMWAAESQSIAHFAKSLCTFLDSPPSVKTQTIRTKSFVSVQLLSGSIIITHVFLIGGDTNGLLAAPVTVLVLIIEIVLKMIPILPAVFVSCLSPTESPHC